MDVLLVDDNADYLELMRQALFISGYNVHTAEDGVEACEVLNSSDIDLIISDVRMPRLDGLKLHTFARDMGRYKRTKFIFISAFKDILEKKQTFNKELDFFFDKTTTVEEIVKFVDKQVFGTYAGDWV